MTSLPKIKVLCFSVNSTIKSYGSAALFERIGRITSVEAMVSVNTATGMPLQMTLTSAPAAPIATRVDPIFLADSRRPDTLHADTAPTPAADKIRSIRLR